MDLTSTKQLLADSPVVKQQHKQKPEVEQRVECPTERRAHAVEKMDRGLAPTLLWERVRRRNPQRRSIRRDRCGNRERRKGEKDLRRQKRQGPRTNRDERIGNAVGAAMPFTQRFSRACEHTAKARTIGLATWPMMTMTLLPHSRGRRFHMSSGAFVTTAAVAKVGASEGRSPHVSACVTDTSL